MACPTGACQRTRSFVHDDGKGVLVVADYAPTCRSPSDIFAPLNAITAPAGIVFSVVDLGYAVMAIDAGCEADFPYLDRRPR